jgi:hypothetical protein
MSDERFYDQVRSTMSGYAPEVPQAAYGKMRRALWWSNFTKLSVTRFNMWYLVAILGMAGGAAAMMSNGNEPLLPAASVPSTVVETPVLPALNASSVDAQTQPACNPGIGCQGKNAASCGSSTAHTNQSCSDNSQNNNASIPPAIEEPFTGTTGPQDGQALTGTPEEIADGSITVLEETPEVVVEPKKDVRTKPYGIKTLVDEKTKKKSPKNK